MKYRSSEPELMDDLSLPETELQLALDDVSLVNRFLGGNKITIDATVALLQEQPSDREYTIVDVGCGDGMLLRTLAKSLRKQQIHAKLIGIDMNPKSLQVGRDLSAAYPEIQFEQHNVLDLEEDTIQCDIILCTLTLHHFESSQIPVFVKKFYDLSTIGVVINDLQRSWLPYGLFTIFSGLFFKSTVAKYDGRISIKRAFKKKELIAFSKALKLSNYTVEWKWAFRYLWIIRKT